MLQRIPTLHRRNTSAELALSAVSLEQADHRLWVLFHPTLLGWTFCFGEVIPDRGKCPDPGRGRSTGVRSFDAPRSDRTRPTVSTMMGCPTNNVFSPIRRRFIAALRSRSISGYDGPGRVVSAAFVSSPC
jgi:hypothetical protein